MTKGNYQQTALTGKMLVGPWYLDEFGNPTREIRGLDWLSTPAWARRRAKHAIVRT